MAPSSERGFLVLGVESSHNKSRREAGFAERKWAKTILCVLCVKFSHHHTLLSPHNR